MKFYTFFVLVFFSFKFTQGQTQPLVRFAAYDTQPLILKANDVKRVQCFKYKITGKGRVDSSLNYICNITYSNTGNINEEITNKKTKTSILLATTYDSSQAVVRYELRINKNAKLDRAIIEENQYDERGRLRNAIRFNEDTTLITRFELEYDSSGRWIRTMYKIEARWAPLNMTAFKLCDSLFYDPDGRIGKIQHYDYSGKKGALKIFNYEGTDEKTITVFEQLNDIQHLISRKKYNKSGFIIENMESYNPFNESFEEQISVNKRYYNQNGTINTSVGYYNNKVVYMYKFFYE